MRSIINCLCLPSFLQGTYDLSIPVLKFNKIIMQITYSVSANVALTVAQTVTNIAGTPEKNKIMIRLPSLHDTTL